MIDVEATIDSRQVEAALDRLQRAGKNLRPVFTKARKALRKDIAEHADREEGPTGRWQRLSAWTVLKLQARAGRQGTKRRSHKIGPVRPPGGRILRRLPKAFKITTGADFIRATSRVTWSGVHWEGGRAGRGAVIPKRDWMWVSDRMVQIVADLAEHRFGAVWSGALDVV